MNKKVLGSFVVGITAGFIHKWNQLENKFDPNVVQNFDS